MRAGAAIDLTFSTRSSNKVIYKKKELLMKNIISWSEVGKLLPLKVRKSLYISYVSVGTAFLSAFVFYEATSYTVPEWFTGVGAVLLFFSVPVVEVARLNALEPEVVTVKVESKPKQPTVASGVKPYKLELR